MEAAGQQGTDDYKDKVEELKRLERAVQQNRSAYIDLNQVVNNLQNTSLLKLQKALKEVRKQMYALVRRNWFVKGATTDRNFPDYRRNINKAPIIGALSFPVPQEVLLRWYKHGRCNCPESILCYSRSIGFGCRALCISCTLIHPLLLYLCNPIQT